ncbi:MAG: cytochrome c3 family protein [Candidatus Brocadiia bacterium]
MARFRRLVRSRAAGLVALGAGGGLALVALGGMGLWATSTDAFCTSCHEMQVVAEQGWMHSAHFHNRGGVVAGCSECHVPPELAPKLWVKTRDGTKDLFVHFFGESDPHEMDWDALAASARAKIHPSACERCHANPTPRGASLKSLVAHRENQRMDEPKSCLECHREEFHGRFRRILAASPPPEPEGDSR